MWLTVCFVNQCATSYEAERKCYLVQWVLWGYILVTRRFFLHPILRSKNSASNFVLIFRKLLRKPTVCYRKPSEIMPWAKATFIMVQTLQGQTNVCRRRRWAFWTNVDKHNTGKHSKLSVGYPCRSWENYPRYLWDSRTVIRDRSTHFVGQFEHETQFCVICAKTAERRPEGRSRLCLQGTQTTSQRRPQLHLQYHNRCWVMGVWLWAWD